MVILSFPCKYSDFGLAGLNDPVGDDVCDYQRSVVFAAEDGGQVRGLFIRNGDICKHHHGSRTYDRKAVCQNLTSDIFQRYSVLRTERS